MHLEWLGLTRHDRSNTHMYAHTLACEHNALHAMSGLMTSPARAVCSAYGQPVTSRLARWPRVARFRTRLSHSFNFFRYKICACERERERLGTRLHNSLPLAVIPTNRNHCFAQTQLNVYAVFCYCGCTHIAGTLCT